MLAKSGLVQNLGTFTFPFPFGVQRQDAALVFRHGRLFFF